MSEQDGPPYQNEKDEREFWDKVYKHRQSKLFGDDDKKRDDEQKK